METAQVTCARIGCVEPASYEKPLCYSHWQEFDQFRIFECERCGRFDELIGELTEAADLCFDCAHNEQFRLPDVPIHHHAPIEYQRRYLYILKLDEGQYYVGQTNDLELRLAEHRDGVTKSTRGRNPRLVYFEEWIGNRKELAQEEANLTKLAAENPRAIRKIVANWQRHLKLIAFES